MNDTTETETETETEPTTTIPRDESREQVTYRIEIYVLDRSRTPPVYVWCAVSPSNGEPYQFETHDEAERMLRMCYPEIDADKRRIMEIKP